MMKDFEHKAYALYKKLDEEKCESKELTKFSEYLTKVLKENTVPSDITLDDIEWFNVYSFLLKKIENREKGGNSNIIEGEWRDIGADFEKLKFIVEELEVVRAIDQVYWSIGGRAQFMILDSREFKRLLFRKAIHKLKDLGISPQKVSETSSSDRLNKFIDKTHSFLTQNKLVVILLTFIFLISAIVGIAGIFDTNSSALDTNSSALDTNSLVLTSFNDIYNHIEKQADEEVTNVKKGDTERLFGGNLSISLISTSYDGYPRREQIFVTVGSPGYPNLEIEGKEVGDVIIYNGTDTFEIRITKAGLLTSEFTVRRT